MERVCEICQNGSTAEILEVLSSQAIDSAYRDANNNTPMFYACCRDFPLVVEALIQHGFRLENISKNGDSALHVAARHACTNLVEFLVTKFPNLCNLRNHQGLSALHSAAEKGSRDIFQRLVSLNMNPMAVNNSNRNVIHMACANGHYAMFKYLIDTYPDLLHMKAMKNWSVSHFTAIGGNIQIMEHLCRLRYNVLQTTSEDTTALHFSSSKGHVEITKFLLAYNSDQLEYSDIQGYRAVHHAAISGNVELLQLLEQAGANMESKTKEGLSILHLACLHSKTEAVYWLVENYSSLLEIKDNAGRSCLLTTAEGGSVDILKYLIRHGMDPMDLSSCGLSPLHFACVNSRMEMAEYIISVYPEQVSIVSENGCAPIHSCVEGDSTRLFDILSTIGNNVLRECGNGLTVLHVACNQKKPKKSEMLKHVAKKFPEFINRKENSLGCYPCHYVAKFHSLDALKVLESCGADMNVVTVHGNSVLHLACETANMETVEYLMRKYPHLMHLRNKAGQSPLHFAIASKNTELVHKVHLLFDQQVRREMFQYNTVIIVLIVLGFAWVLYRM